MFFPERIHLLPSDRILEVGPGASPDPRSQIFLEKRFLEPEATRQRGGLPAIEYCKPVVYYEGDILPFCNREFDYAICSHVVEHVENLEHFVAELTRVAARGYLEFPTVHYEYLYNFTEHLNLVCYNGKNCSGYRRSKLRWMSLLPPSNSFAPCSRKVMTISFSLLEKSFFRGLNGATRFRFEELGASLNFFLPFQKSRLGQNLRLLEWIWSTNSWIA